MNTAKVVSGFFFILAMTLNFGFFYGNIDNLLALSKYELFAAIVVNIIATILKIGDKTQIGAILLASSLVATLQLIASASIWTIYGYTTGVSAEVGSVIISLSGGALLANITSVALYAGDALKSRR